MKRRMVTLVTTTVMVLSLLIGCGNNTDTGKVNSEGTGESENSGGSTTGGDNEITVWAWDPNYNIVALNEAKRIYNEANPEVNINIVEMAKADIEQKLTTVLASGDSEGLPDIVLVEDYNAKKYLSAYPDAFVPYDKVDYSKFASPVDFMTIEGNTYGVPFGLATTALYYRADLFEEAGYTEDDMQNITWEQYADMGKKVKEVTGVDLMTFDPSNTEIIRIMMHSAGSWYTDQDGKPNLADNKALKKAFETAKEVVNTAPITLVADWTEFVGAFNGGKVATVISGCWITPSIITEESQSGQWRIAPTPRMDMEGSGNASNLGGSSFYVLNQENQELAKDFITKTFAESSELYENILASNGIQSMFAPAFESPVYQEPQEFFGGQKTNAILGEWTEEVPAVDFGEYTWEADSIVAASFAEVTNGADIKQTLDSAQEQFEAQIQ